MPAIIYRVLLPCVIVAVGGCSQPYGEVEGTVTLDGKPVKGVVISFIPDYDAGANGLSAQGTTDSEGHYKLHSMSKAQKGVFIGKHLVVCETPKLAFPSDGKYPNHLAKSDDLPARYRSPDKTPLRFEVKEGKQTIDIPLTSKSETK